MNSADLQSGYEFGPFRLERVRRRLLCHGEVLQLRPKAVETLLFLIEHRARIVEKDELLACLWPNTVVEEANLTQYIYLLRKTLGEHNGEQEYILTVPGRGYRFIAVVREPVAEESASSGDTTVEQLPGKTAELPPSIQPAFLIASQEIVPPEKESSTSPIWRGWSWRFVAVALAVVLLTGTGVASLSPQLRSWLASALGRSRAASIPAIGRMEALSALNNALRIAVSRDGRQIAYVLESAEGQSLWLLETGSNEAVCLVPPEAVDYAQLFISPDDRFTYFQTFGKDHGFERGYRVPLAGGAKEFLSSGLKAMSLSPDGRRSAWFDWSREPAEDKLWVAEADRSNARVLAVFREPERLDVDPAVPPSWSPDGKFITCIIRRTIAPFYKSLRSSNATTGAASSQTSRAFAYLAKPQWLPDGSGLIFVAREQAMAPAQLWFAAWPLGQLTQLTNDVNDYRDIFPSADHRLFALLERTHSSIWVAPAEKPDQARCITPENLQANRLEHLSWAGADRLLYMAVTNEQSDLWMTDVTGARRWQLTADAYADFFPKELPDGHALIYSSLRENGLRLWKRTPDGQQQQLTEGPEDAFPSLTPDGQTIVFQRGWGAGRGQIYRVAIAGGTPTLLAGPLSLRPVLSPDGKRMAYFHLDEKAWRLLLRPVFGAGPIINLPALTWASIARWTPDARAVAYIAHHDNVSDIFVQPIASGPPKQLSHFSDTQLAEFEWSRDGKWLVILRRSSERVGVRTRLVASANTPPALGN